MLIDEAVELILRGRHTLFQDLEHDMRNLIKEKASNPNVGMIDNKRESAKGASSYEARWMFCIQTAHEIEYCALLYCSCARA